MRYVALIGWQELVLILIILIFLFGATRMRGLAKGLGDSIREFKNASKDQSDDKEDTNEVIKKAAEKMGISTEGKNIKQILLEMEKKTKKD
ncbi:twin-arginine translocase TatA/TatE family subunit [Candidatus Bathyarchaeota archaeon]|nr:MAG: twin-arginine translocase TatA/TatE family subunit [Candidatus Bathyarchaeota archaeon]